MRVDVYKGASGEWFWRIVADNGRIVADGAEGYDSKSNALRGWKTVLKLILVHADGMR